MFGKMSGCCGLRVGVRVGADSISLLKIPLKMEV